MKYSEARELMQPGDLIGFNGYSLISSVIKMVTKSDISHVGVILKSTSNDCDVTVNQLIESTGLRGGYAGVQISRMSDYFRNYLGRIYWYPLSDESRNKLDVQAMYDFLLSHEGKKYDVPQAILSALDMIPDTAEDFSCLFCSELSSGGYEAGGLVKDINCSEITPADQVNDFDWFDPRERLRV